MHKRVLVDTNIILDMAMQNRPDHIAALQLLDEVEAGDTQAIMAATSCKDVYYVLSKYMGEIDARAYILALMEVFDICAIDRAICLQSALSNEPDFEDGLIRACAENDRVSYIISRDEKAFRKSPTKRLSAAGYIELLDSWNEIGDRQP
ncbi:PIN domain-containing protein [Curtanaerobium respiraculi]|uniref:PIN domain-containing protein n=1 Tax=Curtanaerobium respiraculi TaxID=2949669 RepID=UPI0024B32C39|nr:PIN domain-containing protein [Curtanaerobium respiraculi]